MTAFDTATGLERIDHTTWRWSIPDGWQQGRGAWGGLVVGALVRAVAGVEPEASRAVRSVTAHLAAPALVGEHRIVVEPVRLGSAMSTWEARLVDGQEGVVATAVILTGAPRVADTSGHAEWGVAIAPSVPAATDVPVLPPHGLMPTFHQHLEFRPVAGLPLMGGPAECTGWIGYRDRTPPTAASLMALVDAWWPASLPLLTGMPRIATVSFSATLLADPSTVPADQPLLQHSFVAAAHDGFTSEHRSLWAPDGRLVVDNVQVIAVGA